MKRSVLMMSMLVLMLASVACSPEATRTRGGGPGADVGNHSPNSPAPSTPPSLPAA